MRINTFICSLFILGRRASVAPDHRNIIPRKKTIIKYYAIRIERRKYYKRFNNNIKTSGSCVVPVGPEGISCFPSSYSYILLLLYTRQAYTFSGWYVPLLYHRVHLLGFPVKLAARGFL